MVATKGALYAQTVSIGAVDQESREQMWSLFSRYYCESTRAVFERDLQAKHHVIVLCTRGTCSTRTRRSASPTSSREAVKLSRLRDKPEESRQLDRHVCWVVQYPHMGVVDERYQCRRWS